MDLEISSLEPILFYNPRKDKPLHARIGFLTELAFFPLMFLLSFTKRFISVFVREGFFRSHYRWHNAIGLLLALWMWAVSDFSVSYVVYTWLWINCTGSLIFYSIGVNAAHHHPDAIKDSDQPRSENPDWGSEGHNQQCLRRGDNVRRARTTLHVPYPRPRLAQVHPVFLDLSDKYQANYRVSTQFQMVIGQIKETMRTKLKTVNNQHKK